MPAYSQDDVTHIDDELFEEMRDLLEEDFVSLVQVYMQSSLERMQQLQQAVNDNNNKLGLDIAHTQKGAGANLGLVHLAELCGTMQALCRDDNIASGSMLAKHIDQEISITNALIQQRLDR